MIQECICTNCGALMKFDTSNIDADRMTCPNCGKQAILSSENILFEKFKLNFQEEVRQKIAAEKIEKEKRDDRTGSFIMLAIALFLLLVFGGTYLSHIIEDHKLEALVMEIREDISEERYDDALAKTASIRKTTDWTGESKRKWEETRKDLERLIKEKKGGGIDWWPFW